jgi:hypothetical protein
MGHAIAHGETTTCQKRTNPEAWPCSCGGINRLGLTHQFNDQFRSSCQKINLRAASKRTKSKQSDKQIAHSQHYFDKHFTL